jgi:hypothetical protein
MSSNELSTSQYTDVYLHYIITSITELKKKGGSSRSNIKKYIYANYPIKNDQRSENNINLAIKNGVINGYLVTPKGPAGPINIPKK